MGLPPEILGKALRATNVNLEKTDKDSLTPLCYAVKNRNLPNIYTEMLLDATNIDPNTMGNHISFLSLINRNDTDLNAVDKNGLPAICYIGEDIDARNLIALTNKGTNLNGICDKDAMLTPVHMSFQFGPNVINIILDAMAKAGINLNQVDSEGRNPLYYPDINGSTPGCIIQHNNMVIKHKITEGKGINITSLHCDGEVAIFEKQNPISPPLEWRDKIKSANITNNIHFLGQ